MHLICISPLPETDSLGLGDDTADGSVGNAALPVAIFAHGLRGSAESEPPVASHIFVLVTKAGRAPTPEELAAAALAEIERPQRKPPPHQPPALFSLGGVKLSTADEIARAANGGEGILLFEGGQWLWPAARIGQEHVVRLSSPPSAPDRAGASSASPGADDGASVRLRVLSTRPRILEVDSFLSAAECAHIIGLSEHHMGKSLVSMKEDDKAAGHKDDEFRTSTQHTLQPFQTDELLALSRRVQLLTRLPIEQVEQIQVLRYFPGQHYYAHHDFFDPSDYGSSATGSSRKERGLAENRLATVFFYLDDVAQGGETSFPRAGGLPQPTDFHDCSRGLAVTPKKGRVVIFYSMLPSGEFDHYSLHAGCDVGANATKWAANYWIWNTPQQSTLLHRSLRTMSGDLGEPRQGAELGDASAPASAGAARTANAVAGADGVDARVIRKRASRFDRF